MQKSVVFSSTVAFAILFLCLPVFADSIETTTTVWVSPSPDTLALSIKSFQTSGTASRCLVSNNQALDVNVTVINASNSSLNPSATVTANVHKPASDINSINFTNASDGNYTTRYAFDANGTYRFEVHAAHNGAVGDKNAFMHVGLVGMSVSFPQNSQTFNAGTTQVIRARVTNSDGNVFEGITGTISINYPNGTSFVNSAAMTEIGDGNYSYTFTVPSTSGNYTFSVSFSCGLNSNTNSSGSFTVPSSGGGGDTGGDTGGGTGGGGGGGGGGSGEKPKYTCGNFICERGESAKNCFVDCAVSAGPDGQLLSWRLVDANRLGEPSGIIVDLKNIGNRRLDYILSVTITQGREVEYIYEQSVEDVDVREIINVMLEQKWIPRLGGSHEIVVALYSTDKRTKFDEIIDSFDLGGVFRYDVIVQCLDNFVKLGSPIDANITYWNMGDFFEDVDISYWVESPTGEITGKSVIPVALYPNEPKSLLESIFVPDSFLPGNYFFKARVDFRTYYKEGSCSFSVEREPEYYSKLVSLLQSELDSVKLQVLQKELEGNLPQEIKNEINELQNALDQLKQKFALNDFAGAESKTKEISSRIESLKKSVNLLEKGFIAGLFIPLGIILMVLLLLISLSAKNKFLKDKLNGILDRMLALDKKVYSRPFNEKKPLEKLLRLK